ncbi:hypothetical protein [Sediminibacillus halophilus]|uniref:Uncharacterized protein n=1 Tax=Sediminibacillus halophilus TaxID=482461 RepID=A0A1G9T7S4_9BACI|nr:hypothetical protein [Sediminibacillus halophilus]SDM43697.1 hypothetical protein SAMN05216244_2471 [Sediminibacillus halophilus]
MATLLEKAEQLFYDRDLPKEQTTETYGGESEHWKVMDYTIKANPALFRTFAGRIYMKGQELYQANYFKSSVHVVVDRRDDIPLHEQTFSTEGEDVDPGDLEISEQSTGEFSAEWESYQNKRGEPLAIADISEVYIIVEWRGVKEEDIHEERISLQPVEEQT